MLKNGKTMGRYISRTSISIENENFLINGKPLQEKIKFQNISIEGLLMNSRMANAIFDDANPFTKHLWIYPDTKKWNPERNTDELIQMLKIYLNNGLKCININLQGASPLGYYRSDKINLNKLISKIQLKFPNAKIEDIWDGLPSTNSQPWDSGAFNPDGSLKEKFLNRASKIIEEADRIGMMICLGFFYFGQDERLEDEKAVINAVDNAVKWVLGKKYKNTIIEINNECDVPKYEHEILQQNRIHELIEYVSKIRIDNNKLYVGTSFTKRMLPTDNVINFSDFIILHGNGIDNPHEIKKYIKNTRKSKYYRGQPIFFNEDDHFDFNENLNNFTEALRQRVGWGFFDPGHGAGGSAAYGDYINGFQNPPINWTINTQRKKEYFSLMNKITSS